MDIFFTRVEQTVEWIFSDFQVEVEWSDSELHRLIAHDYLSNLSLRELPSAELLKDTSLEPGTSTLISAEKAACCKQDLQKSFMVPTLGFLHESEKGCIVKEYHLVKAFLGFLLQLLHHKLDLMRVKPREDPIYNLEDLGFLLTNLREISWMLCDDEHEEFHELLAEFQAVHVPNEAGSSVAAGKRDEAGLAVVLNRIDHLKNKIMKFLAISLSSSRSAYMTPIKTFALDSLSIVDSLIHDLKDLMNQEENSIADVEYQIKALLQGLSLLQSSVKDIGSLASSRSAYMTPKTSALDSLLIVDSLIHDLEDLMNREDNPIADVKVQIEALHQGLSLLQSSIKDIGSPKPSEVGELKETLMRIGDMAREAQYLIISFLVGDVPLWYLISWLTDVNHIIEIIGRKLQEITKKYKAGVLKVAKDFNPQLSLQAKTNTEVDDVTVGLEEKATDILDKLVGGTERRQVISIIGMPGLGKTTLANKLYNHPLVADRFDKRSWSVASRTYSRKSLLADILIHIASELGKEKISEMEEEIGKDKISEMEEEVGKDEISGMEEEVGEDKISEMEEKRKKEEERKEEVLVEHIYKTLKGRRYFIVIDDIWDSNVWDDMKRCFPDDGNSSRILFTSRNKDVAPLDCIPYLLPSLSEDQSWELLEKKVFHNKSCPTDKLLSIGKKIAANCHGLPLTVVVVGGILSSMDKDESTWKEVARNLDSYITGHNSVMQILELSYKHLSEQLKPCFLYFGACQEDKEIPAGKLMRLWIAEGFIYKKKGKSAENVAEEFLMELIDKSLVMVAKTRSDGGVKSCVIHDLLLDLCMRICEEENFLKFRKEVKPIPQRLALDNFVPWCYCQQVRSFYCHHEISPFCVRDMRLLRVLHHSYFGIEIEYLVNLRYLVISNYLLASIGGLVNLEYLSLTPETMVTVYLPPTIVKMRKLRYIHVERGTAKYDKQCNSSQTNNLEFLSGIIITEPKDEEMLKCSPHLRKLKCTYVGGLMEKRAYPHFDLRFLTQLDSLNLRFHHCLELGMLKEFGFPSKIRKLTLSESRFHWETMSIIGRLENLEVLKLGFDPFVGERWDTRDGEFQKLTFLKLDGIDLTEWSVDSYEHFPSLQQLILYNCQNLLEIPSEIGEITTLLLISVQGRCKKSLVESAESIKEEQCEDMSNEEFRVIIDATDFALGIAISSESDGDSDTSFEQRRVWKDFLDAIK